MTNSDILLLHISDLHFYEENNKNIDVINNIKKISNFIETIEKAENTKCLICITGDITDNGKIKEFNNFLDASQKHNIADRLIIVPGNHDACTIGNEIGLITFKEESVQNYQRIQASLLCNCRNFVTNNIDKNAIININSISCEPFINGKRFIFWNKTTNTKCITRVIEYTNRKIIFVLLDSNPKNVTLDINFAKGEIGKRQLNILKEISNNKKYKGWTKIVLLHHHPIYNNFFLKLEDSNEFLQTIWSSFNIILFGHKHCPNEWTTPGGYIIAAPALFDSMFMYGILIKKDNSISIKTFTLK